MLSLFEAYLRTHTSLSDEDIAQVCAVARPRVLQRSELLLREGSICRHKAFVASGLLRSFGTTVDGSEHILQFSPADSWTMDVESYDREIPAQTNIAAIERSEVLLWAKPDFDRLLNDLPQLRVFSQQLIARNIYNGRNRLLAALSATPEEKYEDFVRSFPDYLSRLPLHMIASYLGISLKTLTRIRHAQVHR